MNGHNRLWGQSIDGVKRYRGGGLIPFFLNKISTNSEQCLAPFAIYLKTPDFSGVFKWNYYYVN